MDHLQYAKNWINRPIFSGLESDKEVLLLLVSEIEDLRKSFDNPIAYSRINDKGDLFDLRLQANPFIENLVPLYLRPDYAKQRQQTLQSKSKKP